MGIAGCCDVDLQSREFRESPENPRDEARDNRDRCNAYSLHMSVSVIIHGLDRRISIRNLIKKNNRIMRNINILVNVCGTTQPTCVAQF